MAASTAVNRQRQDDPTLSPQQQQLSSSSSASSSSRVCPPSKQAEWLLIQGLVGTNWRDRRSLRLAQFSEMIMTPRWNAAASAAVATSCARASSSAHRFHQTRRRRESMVHRRVISAAPLSSTLVSQKLSAAQPTAQPETTAASLPSSTCTPAPCPSAPSSVATATGAAGAAGAAAIVEPENAVNVCPESYLVELLRKRGRVVTQISSTEAGYCQPPTAKQVHDYDSKPFMSDLARRGDLGGLQQALEAGRGMDASNKFGESVVHVACRRSNMDVLRFLLANGGSRTCCDDLGRFPLHEVCWAVQPRFDIVRLFLGGENKNSNSNNGDGASAAGGDTMTCLLLVTDKRGCTPLRYVREGSWPQWRQFLDEVVDKYWPSVN